MREILSVNTQFEFQLDERISQMSSVSKMTTKSRMGRRRNEENHTGDERVNCVKMYRDGETDKDGRTFLECDDCKSYDLLGKSIKPSCKVKDGYSREPCTGRGCLICKNN